MIKVEISSMHVFTRSCKILTENDRTQKNNQRIQFFVHQSAKRDREIIKSPRRINTGMKCEEILIIGPCTPKFNQQNTCIWIKASMRLIPSHEIMVAPRFNETLLCIHTAFPATELLTITHLNTIHCTN